MATLTITKNYADGTLLEEAELDPFINNMQTFINTTKINDDNIQNQGITASTKLADGTITAGKINAGAVTEVTILASNVTTTNINDSAVTEAKIPASNITIAKIADSTVASADFSANSVTYAKTTLNYNVINPDQTIPSSYPDINLTSDSGRVITWNGLTFHNRPVMVQIILGKTLIGTASNMTVIAGFRNESTNDTLTPFHLQFSGAVLYPSALNFFWETTGSGTYEFNLTFVKNASPATFNGSDTSPTRPTVIFYEL